MTDSRVTDPIRIAQLLASELSGLELGPFADVSLVDVDTDATPSDDGTVAYRVAYREHPVVTVLLYPGAVVLSLPPERTWPELARPAATADDIDTDDGRLRVTSGAAVKRAVDALRDVLGSLEE